MARDDKSFENKDNFGAFDDFMIDYDDQEDSSKEEEKKEQKSDYDSEKDLNEETTRMLESQISMDYDSPKQEEIDFDTARKIKEIEDQEPDPVKYEEPKKDLKSQIIKYATWAFIGLIVFIILMALLTSSKSSGTKKEKKERNITLSSGEKYSFANDVGDYKWESSENEVATVTTTGEIQALKKGTTIITITTDNEIITYKVTVEDINQSVTVTRIKMDKNTLELNTGDNYEMHVNIYPENATSTDISWSSSNDEIATVDSNGKITAISKGNCTITARSSNGNYDICLVKVDGNGKKSGIVGEIQEIKFTSSNIVLKEGIDYIVNYSILPENAKGDIEWISSNESIATVEDGVIKTIKEGTISIIARNGTVEQSLTLTVVKGDENTPDVISDGSTVPVYSISLNQTEVGLYVGTSYTLSALFNPSNATNQTITWTSSDNSIVSVDANGIITGIKIGEANITATSHNNKIAICHVKVIANNESKIEDNKTEDTKISLDTSYLSLNINETAQLIETITPNGSVTNVKWSSSNEKIAKVSDSGMVTGVGVGNATITATLSNGAKAECTVNVSQKIINPFLISLSQTRLNLSINESRVITATVRPDNATNKNITWSSSNTNVATVNANGKVTAKANGTAIITARTVNGIKAQCTVVVNGGVAIKFNKTTTNLEVGKTEMLIPTITNGTRSNIKWSSSNTNVATVDSNGRVTGKKAGTANITATISNTTATCKVTVYEVKPVVDSSIIGAAVSLTDGLDDIEISKLLENTYNDTINIDNHNYKIFKQRNFREYSFWYNGNIADNGAAPIALSIILSGYMTINPVSVANYMGYASLDRIIDTSNYYGFDVGKIIYYDSYENNDKKIKEYSTIIKKHLEEGNPIIAYVSGSSNSKCIKYKYSGNNHYIAILGLDSNNNLIVGNPGILDGSGTIEELLNCYMPGNDKALLLLFPNK